jgi:AraC-like DNA-binding protein
MTTRLMASLKKRRRSTFVLANCEREHENLSEPCVHASKNIRRIVAFSICLWHLAVLQKGIVMAPEISHGDGWCGMALVARLQVAAGTLEIEKQQSNDLVLRAVGESVRAIDWASVPAIEFVVARSVVARFLCEIASRQSNGLLPSRMVTRLESMSADLFGATVADVTTQLLSRHGAQTTASNVDPRVQNALAFIRLNCERRVRIDELATTVGLSRWHLERLTRKYTGASLRDHSAAARMERATLLLAQGRLSIKELASRLGYGNASAFTRYFRKRYGASPRNWRRPGTRVR